MGWAARAQVADGNPGRSRASRALSFLKANRSAAAFTALLGRKVVRIDYSDRTYEMDAQGTMRRSARGQFSKETR